MIAKSDIAILSASSVLLLVAIMRLDGPSVSGTTNSYYTNGKAGTYSQVARGPSSAGTSGQNTSLATPGGSDPVTGTNGTAGSQNAAQGTAQGTSQNVAQGTTQTATQQAQTTTVAASNSTGTGGTSTEFKQPDVIREASFTTHIVKRGEYLSLIARRYKTTVDELKKLNNIEGTTILVGQELVYPTN